MTFKGIIIQQLFYRQNLTRLGTTSHMFSTPNNLLHGLQGHLVLVIHMQHKGNIILLVITDVI